MLTDDPRHGTTRGHFAGCRETCCREARNAYERQRRKRRQVLGEVRRIDAIGTARRIRALMALGWPAYEIGRRCGWTTGEAVLEVANRRWVYVATATAIASVYDDLCMTIGPSRLTSQRGLVEGWVPPLAWDDIDDPDEQPTGWEYRPRNTINQYADATDPVVVMRLLQGDRVSATPTERRAALQQWVADGGTEAELCRWHGWKGGRYSGGLRLVREGVA